jgi:hypothetical protein
LRKTTSSKDKSPWHDVTESLPPSPGLYFCLVCFRPIAGDKASPVLFPDVQRFLPDEDPPRFSGETLHGLRVRYWMPIPPLAVPLYLERPESSLFPDK